MPKLSVCIATYNGDKYIYHQLQSILSQLSADDEVIVSDDSSTDETIAVINSFNDARVKLYRNNLFKNPIYNFEHCISRATGDIIFMSDQDDLWLPSKVATVCAVFNDDPAVTLVASDALIINEAGEVVNDSFYSGKANFSSNVLSIIVKNLFLGCTLAFRRSMLEVLLPFPRQLPMHDSWIGIMNQLYGRVHFIDVPLIAYRRHSQNFSSSTHASLLQMTAWRLKLIKAVIGRVLKCRAGKNVI